MSLRFTDTKESIYTFADRILVHCPQCNACAEVVPIDARDARYWRPRRLACHACGYIREWHGKSIRFENARDLYFHLPLWLQVPCAGHLLWAYNGAHLAFVESFVRAKLRESTPPYASLANRLPTWIKLAKNRDDVLRGIAKLRKMLE